MKKRFIAIYVACTLLVGGCSLLGMDADQKRQERATFAHRNKQVMLKAFDDGKMSAVFDCLSSGASIDDLILYAFTYGRGLNPVDENGRTFLHYAVLFGTARTIKKLVSNGANPFIVDKTGQSPLGLLYSQLERAKEQSSASKQQITDSIKKHTDMCNKLSTKINAGKEAYIAAQRTDQGKIAFKNARLQYLTDKVASVKEIEDQLKNDVIDKAEFDRLRSAYPLNFETERNNIEQNFDAILEESLSDYAKGRDLVRDKMLQDAHKTHAKKLAKLRDDERRFDQKVIASKEILDIFQNEIKKSPELKKVALEHHLGGSSSDLYFLLKPAIDHLNLIKKIKGVCPLITGIAAVVIVQCLYGPYVSSLQQASFRTHLQKVKTSLLNIDFDIHTTESTFKPSDELFDIELLITSDEQHEKLTAAVIRFDELVFTLYERIKTSYFYHPSSYFVEQEAALVNELEQTYTTIITILDESKDKMSIKKSMRTLLISGIAGVSAFCYYRYANPLKRWGLF